MPADAYQVGGDISSGVQTGYSGLTTTITVSGMTSESWASNTTMNSGRDWSVDFTTYTPDVRTQKGMQWVTTASGCSFPSAGATTSGCSKGSVTFAFSRPVRNPVFHVHDFGGRFEANCKLAIQGTLTISGYPISKLSGGIAVSGSSITGRASSAPMVESNHSSGSVQITGLVSTVTFSESVAQTRQG